LGSFGNALNFTFEASMNHLILLFFHLNRYNVGGEEEDVTF